MNYVLIIVLKIMFVSNAISSQVVGPYKTKVDCEKVAVEVEGQDTVISAFCVPKEPTP